MNEKGHKVRILTADYSHLRALNPSEKKNFEITTTEDIEHRWTHTSKYTSNGIRRAVTMFQFCSAIWFNAKKIARKGNNI